MSSETAKKPTTTLNKKQVFCQNECGYFGNPEWLGYCSKCHRELNQKTKPERSSKKVQRSHSDAQDSLGFSKFEEKKKQQSHKGTKTIKSIIKRGHTIKESTSQSPSRDLFPIGEVFLHCKDVFLMDSAAKDVSKQVQKQLEVMNKCYDKSIDEQSEVMQEFYNYMFNRCEINSVYSDMEAEEIDKLMDKIEELLMNNLHRTVTQQISSEYEEKDLALQKRIRSLNWISSEHLGLNILESSPQVRDLIDKAIADVIQMESKTAPQQKIKCIVNCSNNIISIINLCQGVTVSADEFLPTMVYIVLKANPPLLQSNMKYITSYSIPARLRSGEGAYYFTNLCCAVAFIEGLTAESLNMNEDEFQRYLSGELPVAHVEQSATDCEGLRLMTHHLNLLTEMQERNSQVLSKMDDLKEDMLKFQEIVQKCNSVSPYKIKETPYTVPANTDMSLIPDILRSRVLLDGPVEDILVDIDFKTEPSENVNLETDKSLQNNSFELSAPLSTTDPYISEFSGTPLNGESSSSVPNISNFSTLQPLQVLLPTPRTDVSEGFAMSDNSMLQGDTFVQNYSQPVNIKDLEYPTELFPDSKSDENSVEFGPFESCDPIEVDTKYVIDPLSPEASFMDENLHLPPPLQPVVVQSVNMDSVEKIQ